MTHTRSQEGPVMTAALYIRVSTRDKQHPENQTLDLKKLCAGMKWDVGTVYIDKVTGSGKSPRPEFNRMMLDASKHQFDVLVFWSIDRFSREGIVKTLSHLERLNQWKVKYRSYQEPFIDTTTEFGDLLVAFVAKIAQLERVRIRERIMSGLERAKAEGKRLGRPRLTIDRQKIRDLHKQGLSLSKIQSKMKLKCRATVFNIVHEGGQS